MLELPDHYFSSTQAAAALVLAYAPLLRQVPRLPHYRQPQVTWEVAPTCDPAFAAAMRAVWAKIDLRDSAQFSEAEALLLRYYRMHGALKLYRLRLDGVHRAAPAEWHRHQVAMLVHSLGTILGDAMLALMPEAERTQWFPMHGLDIASGRDVYSLTILCDSLGQQETSTGQLMYFATQRPTAFVQGQRRPVAFTAHAIQRMQSRLCTFPTHFNSLHDVFAYMQYCHHFEPVTLYPNQPAIALFDECIPGFFSACYVEALVGADANPHDYVYRLGYCPLVQEGDCWLAKTFLMPGYSGTPEYQVLYRTSLDSHIKARMLAACEEMSQPRLATTDDWSLLRWFHTHGIAQVISAPDDTYVRE